MAKGLVLSITAKQARSYERLSRNGASRKVVKKSTRTGASSATGLGGRSMTTRKTTRKKARKARRTPAQKAATRKMIAAAKRARAAKKRSLKANPRKRKAAKKSHRKVAHRKTTHRKAAKKSHRKTTHRRTTKRTMKSNKRGVRRATKRVARKATRRSGAKKASSRRRHVGPIFLSAPGFMRNPVSPEVAAAYTASTKAGFKYPAKKKMLPKGAPGTKSHRLAGIGMGVGSHGAEAAMESYGEAVGAGLTDAQRAQLEAMHAKTKAKISVAEAYRSMQTASESYAKQVAAVAAEAAQKAATTAAAQASQPSATPAEKRAASKAEKEAAKAAKAAERAAAAQTAAAARKAAAEAKVAEKKAKADAAAAKAAKWHRLMPRRIKDRVGFKYGKHTSLVAKVGKHKFPTYVYETPKGTLRHFSPSQLVGAKIGDKRPEVVAAIAKLKEHRAKAAKTSPFIPNRKHGGAHVISFAQWKKMKANGKRVVHLRDLRLYSNAGMRFPVCKAGAKLLDTSASRLPTTSSWDEVTCAKCKTLAKKRYPHMYGLRTNGVHVGGKGKYNRRRHQIAQVIYNELKHHGAKHERRLRPAALAYVSSFVSHGPKKHNNITRATAVKDTKEIQSFLGIRRFPSFGNINKPFKFKRNPGMATFAQTVKAAAPLTGGFAAALALTKLVGDQLSSALAGNASTAEYAKYSKLVSAAVVPAVGAAVTTRIDAIPSKNEVAAGMVAAGILGVIKQGLGLAGQEKAAEYLSGLGASNVNYTNAKGSALPNYLQGMGAYYLTSGVPAQATNGLGAYYLTSGVPAAVSGLGAAPTFTQAAAGLGAGPNALITQAAAGMGEYFAPRGVSGLGQYEDKGISQAAAGLGLVKEGIMPNTQSAERALQFAEAAAGLGDLPLVSTNEPVDTYVPVDDAPEGSRAGVFTGGDGIFG